LPRAFLDTIKHSIRSKKSGKKANRYLEEFKDALMMQERDLNSAIEEGEVQLYVDFIQDPVFAFPLTVKDWLETQNISMLLDVF
jgi:hypothetical protein